MRWNADTGPCTGTIPVSYTHLVIMDEKGARAMGKPVGTYLTLEASRLAEKDENYHREVSEELAKQLKLLIQEQELKKPKILVVGLGNRLATPCLLYTSIREVTADVDETKLSLALSNLVENAIKYNREEGWRCV